MPRFFLLTGCSGAGKSTTLDALAARGADVIAEPGRRIVQEQQARGGDALPWRDMDHASKRLSDDTPVFCDRGLVDAALALERMGAGDAYEILAEHPRYDATVFLFEPWPALFQTDAERQHSFDAAVEEYEAIASALQRLGYTAVLVPQQPPEHRAEFIFDSLITLGRVDPNSIL